MIYDYNTTNESFINIHLLLEKLGIKNNKFHLVLNNPLLAGVDPYSPDLTAEVKLMITEEVHNNFWYFYRELLRIPQSGSSGGKFVLTYSTIVVLYLMFHNRNFIIIQSRQSGKTFIVNAETGRAFNFENNITYASAGIQMAMVNYAERSLLKNLAQIDNILNLLPEYLRFHKKVFNEKTGTYTDRKDRSSAQRVYENKSNKNQIFTYVLGDSEEKAKMAVRGESISVTSIDEVNFLKHNITLLGSAIPATKAEMRNAALNNLPYGIRIMTTPDITTKHGRAMEDLIENKFINWEHEYFDMTKDELDKKVRENSDITGFDIFVVEYDYDELGYGDEWLHDSRLNITKEQFKSEVLLMREAGSSLSPFNRETLIAYRTVLDDAFCYKAFFNWNVNNEEEDFKQNVIDFTIYPENGYTCVDEMNFYDFLKQYKDVGIILGIDTSQGTGNDNTAFVFLNAKTTKMIASLYRDDLTVNHTYVIVSKLIQDIIDIEMIPFVINNESTGIGLGLTQRFIMRSHIEKYMMIQPKNVNNTYNSDSDDQITKEFNIKGKKGKYIYGWKNTSNTRSEMMNVIIDAVNTRHKAFLDEDLYREVCDLIAIKTRSGNIRFEATPGSHDDFLLALGIALDPIIKFPDILEIKFNIKVDPTSWIIVDGQTVINPITKRKSRIEIFLKETNGLYYNEYYDTISGILVDKETAYAIMDKESEYSDIIDNDTKNNTDDDIDALLRNRNTEKTFEVVGGEYRPDLNNEEYYNQIAWGANDDNYSNAQPFINYWSMTTDDYDY